VVELLLASVAVLWAGYEFHLATDEAWHVGHWWVFTSDARAEVAADEARWR
jgi:hypothetical protein